MITKMDIDWQDRRESISSQPKARLVRQVRLLAWGCLALAALLLGGGYAPLGYSWLAGAALLLALLGMAGWRWAPLGGLALTGFTALAAVGFWLGVWAGWLLGGFALALAGWDLAAFGRFLQAAPHLFDPQALLPRHLLRLGIALLGGLALAASSLFFQVRLSLGGALALALLAAGGLGWGMIRYRSNHRYGISPPRQNPSSSKG